MYQELRISKHLHWETRKRKSEENGTFFAVQSEMTETVVSMLGAELKM